jgi:hypothetical protein
MFRLSGGRTMYVSPFTERERERERERGDKYYNYILLISEYFNSMFWVEVLYIYIYMSAGNYHMKLRGWVCTCIHTSCGGGLKPLDRSDQKSGESDQISSIFFFSGSQISLSFVCFN